MSPSAIGFHSTPGRMLPPAVHNVEEAERRGPGRKLTSDEQRLVRELKQRDRAVRAHERAHKAAAGAHARHGTRPGQRLDTYV